MNTKRIIVGYDFSDNSKHALQIALNMAEAFDGQVHLVTALPGHLDPKVLKAALDKASPRHDQLYAVEALIESMEGRVRETTASLNNLSRMTSIDVMQIRAPEAITEVADMREADLIVLGATGLGSLERLMLGSTSQRLVHTSRWPVLVVKPELMWPPQRVVCAVDFSDASANAVEMGATLATEADRGVTLMNVVETTPARMLDTFGVSYVDNFAKHREELRAQARKALARFAEDTDALEHVPWTTLIADGLIEDCIIQAASQEADLLCMGSVGRAGLQGLFLGNTAERVLRALPCSMLITKPDAFVLKPNA